MAAPKKSAKRSSVAQTNEPSSLVVLMAVAFTALSVVFAWLAYINYGY